MKYAILGIITILLGLLFFGLYMTKITPRQVILMILAFIVIVIVCYAIYQYFNVKKKNQEYLKSKLKIMEYDVIGDNAAQGIIIYDDHKKVVWANNIAYTFFPELLKNRSLINFINNKLLNQENFFLKHQDYYLEIKNNNNILYIIDNSSIVAREKEFEDKQFVIGHLKIDNYDYIQTSINQEQKIKLNNIIKSKINEWFVENNILYNELAEDSYIFYISRPQLKSEINKKFPIREIMYQEFKKENIPTGISMGIAFDFPTNIETGRRAEEALNLAISRGGDQVVIFQYNRDPRYFGGSKNIEGMTSKLRSKVISSAIEDIIRKEDKIYVMVHKKADIDAIGAILILNRLVGVYNKQLKVLLSPDYGEQVKNIINHVTLNYVTEIEEGATLFVLDTQSKDIVSHPEALKKADKVIIVDHHATPDHYIDQAIVSYIVPNTSSTCELMLDIANNYKKIIDFEHFELNVILAGIITDTNNFKHRVTQYTFQSVAFAMSKGANFLEAQKLVQLSYEDLQLKNKIFINLRKAGHLTYSIVAEKIESDLQSSATDDLLGIANTSIALTASLQAENTYQIKIRTQNDYRASYYAKKIGGDGHNTQAAAVISDITESDLEKLILDIFKKEIKG